MDHQPLRGQKALVTGANSGIGEGVARALGAAGASVVVKYVSKPEAAVEAMFAETHRAWGGIDILVNNAGLQRDAPFTEMTLDQWNTVLGVNLTGMFLCARAAARAMIRRGLRPEISRAEALASLLKLIPYGCIGVPADIGRAVAWLASDDADYIHGQTIYVDGGMTLYPELYLGQRIPLAGVAHQNGTIRFGRDPQTSALDANCKAHEVDNLYVVDGSVFPSSAAVNPALTIMANALRVGEHLRERLA